jgi:hypothetical protein
VPTLDQIVDAVWSTEIQPGLTAREILVAWLRYIEAGIDVGVEVLGGPDEEDLKRWLAASAKAAARFAQIEVPVIKITDGLRTATTSSYSPPKQITQHPPTYDEQDDIDMVLMALLV